MGKIYKNSSPATHTIPAPMHFITTPPRTETTFVLPQASVIPLDQFNTTLQRVTLALENDQINDALQDLVNLEVTDFSNITVHELLADVFLKLNQLTLAKEQCQICAQLISQQHGEDNIFTLKSFDDLVRNAGDINAVQKQYDHIMIDEVSESNFHKGTQVALNLATLHISENRYSEAEKILVAYRDRYLEGLKIAN